MWVALCHTPGSMQSKSRTWSLPHGACSLVEKTRGASLSRMATYPALSRTVQNAYFPGEMIESPLFTLQSNMVWEINDTVIFHINHECQSKGLRFMGKLRKGNVRDRNAEKGEIRAGWDTGESLMVEMVRCGQTTKSWIGLKREERGSPRTQHNSESMMRT